MRRLLRAIVSASSASPDSTILVIASGNPLTCAPVIFGGDGERVRIGENVDEDGAGGRQRPREPVADVAWVLDADPGRARGRREVGVLEACSRGSPVASCSAMSPGSATTATPPRPSACWIAICVTRGSYSAREICSQ